MNARSDGLSYMECKRDSGVQTNLFCSRCGDAICPSCMIYTPVGSKCPECASIGGPEMFKVSREDLWRGVILGVAGAVAISVVVATLVVVLWSVDLLEGLPAQMWIISNGLIQFGGAYAPSLLLAYLVGNKYANSLRVLAAMLSLVFFAVEIVAIGFIASLGDIGVDARIVVNLGGILGFAFGTYYAMNRFRP